MLSWGRVLLIGKEFRGFHLLIIYSLGCELAVPVRSNPIDVLGEYYWSVLLMEAVKRKGMYALGIGGLRDETRQASQLPRSDVGGHFLCI